MTTIKLRSYEYKSALSTHINGLVSEKRELGYIYNNEAKILKHLDSYWIENHYPDEVFSWERLEGWCQKTETEGNKSLSNRIVATRQLAIYIQSLGQVAFIPEHNIRIEKPLIHVLSSQEINELFQEIDSYHPPRRDPHKIRLSHAYRVHFRLLLCLGLRRTESCLLRVANFNRNDGSLMITETKNDNHRIIYLGEDLSDMLARHIEENRSALGFSPEWIFPGYDPSMPVGGGTLSERFNQCWNKTSFSGKVDRKPTLHSLRHTFVVLRIKQWESEGKDVNALLPYLSRHLGHVCLDDTYYYYQRIMESLEHIRKKDTVANTVLPEVLLR